MLSSDTSLSLVRDPQAVGNGRRYVASACRGFDDEFTYTAALCASELITNALQHGTGAVTVGVSSLSAGVRVDVSDAALVSGLVPTQRTREQENGRGLQIVDALATAWGTDGLPHGGGKTVWFVLLA